MDLISKTALLNDLCEDREEGTFCFTDSQAEAADKIIAYVTKRINAQIPISAVPLAKLCEWLAKNACYYQIEDNGGSTRFSLDACQWKFVLAKWMEEQDAAD